MDHHTNSLDTKKRAVNTTEAFRTFPLADSASCEPNSNEAIPSAADVKEAKDWVDFNEK